MTCRRKCTAVSLVLGILAIIVGTVIIIVPNKMLPGLLKKALPIVPSSATFEPWSNPGKLPVNMEFYFFNIKNNLHTQKNGESTDTPIELGGNPIVEEKGPYVYRETRKRSNISFNEDQTELTFSEKTEFKFDSSASIGTEDDVIYGLNMPLLTVFGLISRMSDGGQKTMAVMLFNGMANRLKLQVVQKKNVSDWLWGADSEILQQLKQNINMLPPEMRDKATTTEFGYMMDNGASTQWVIGTGFEDLRDVAQIKKYNGKSELNFWGSCYSNQIEGTDGTIFHPNVDPEETLFMFSSDICRSIYAKKEGEQVVKGVKTLVFTPPSDVFASPEENSKNVGFCEPKPCLGSGLLRVTNCRHDAPLVISQPHLCDADENVTKTISGIKPDPTKHKTRLFIEPNLGVMVKAHKRLQFNALLLAESEFELTKQLKKYQIVPLFWVQEGFTGDDEFASMLNSNVNLMTFFPKYGDGIFITLVVIGLILIIIAFFFTIKTTKDGDHTKFIVPTVTMSSIKKREENNFGYSRQ